MALIEDQPAKPRDGGGRGAPRGCGRAIAGENHEGEQDQEGV